MSISWADRRANTNMDVVTVNHHLQGLHHDLEAGRGARLSHDRITRHDHHTPHSVSNRHSNHASADEIVHSDSSTLCSPSADLSQTTTGSEDSNTDTLDVDDTHPGPLFEDPAAGLEEGFTLMRIKTETAKKWSTNRTKGIKITTKYFYQEIDNSWTVSLIMVCFFVAGLVDAVSFQCWGAYVTMQTGNTILVALRVSAPPADRHTLSYLKNVVSIVCYCLGSLGFNILHRAPTGLSNSPTLHRWTLIIGFAIQSMLLVVSAVLASAGVVSTTANASGTVSLGLGTWWDLLPVGLLAFEAAGQVCVSRVLMASDLPTIVISTLYHDFMGEILRVRKDWRGSDTYWAFAVTQKKQVRRLCAIICLFVGALIGGFMYVYAGGIAGALWVAAGCKMCISLAWVLWKKRTVTETVVTTRAPEGKLEKTKSVVRQPKQSPERPSSPKREKPQESEEPLDQGKALDQQRSEAGIAAKAF